MKNNPVILFCFDRNPNSHTGEKSVCIIRVGNITEKYVCVCVYCNIYNVGNRNLTKFPESTFGVFIISYNIKKKSETYPELSQEDFEQQQDCSSKITIMKQPEKLAE